jgi:GntR family transcriptional regulator, transcriptional repressor for pyruvate dehydrogenase complex
MQVEKISTKKVSASVEEQLEKMIHSGMVKAGEKLPSVRELCELFGVGRSAVRDAITTLSGKGSVYVKRGEGTFVSEFDSSKLFNQQVLLSSPRDISELFQVRKLLETGMAELAAVNRTKEDLHNLKAALSNESTNPWDSDYQLHLTIAKATGNEILVGLIQFISTTMKKVMMDFHHYIQQDEKKVNLISRQHQQIIESIEKGDPKSANQCMSNHLNTVEELLQGSVLSNQ